MLAPPTNVVFSLVLVPIFEWVHSEPDNEVPPAPVASDCEASESTSPADPAAPSAPAKRLVLKGFEWRPTAEYVLFPPAPWANCFDCGSSEATAQSVKDENERRARAAEAARNQRAQVRVDPIKPTTEPVNAASTAEGDGAQPS